VASSLDPDRVDADPIVQFQRWFADAVAAGEPEPETMSLATATLDGHPSARFVLLKGVGPEGFAFYTNLGSRKSEELAANPMAALAWRWRTVERQVRVSGPVGAVPAPEADAYFASRPRGSQLGAWASDQSHVIRTRVTLEEQLTEVTARFAGESVPRPPFWGGWRVRPDVVEFWENRADRLHDRVRYRHPEGGGAGWVIERLAP
jgi:pyridoxamine 5'-phosphate oxidase